MGTQEVTEIALMMWASRLRSGLGCVGFGIVLALKELVCEAQVTPNGAGLVIRDLTLDVRFFRMQRRLRKVLIGQLRDSYW
jgi:hypothetical protein